MGRTCRRWCALPASPKCTHAAIPTAPASAPSWRRSDSGPSEEKKRTGGRSTRPPVHPILTVLTVLTVPTVPSVLTVPTVLSSVLHQDQVPRARPELLGRGDAQDRQ